MNRPRLFRWCRIAVSAVCVVVFVGLIGLWVRSYSYLHFFEMDIAHGKTLHIQSVNGNFMLFLFEFQRGWRTSYFYVGNGSSSPVYDRAFCCASTPGVGITVVGTPSSGLKIPIWIFVSISAALAFVPWLRQLPWRFSLRTLLIVTTLVAVVLGFVVWVVRG